MGTLGCINDMLQRDKENRALRKISRERMKNTGDRLRTLGPGSQLSDISAKKIEEIRRDTIANEKAKLKLLFLDKLILFGCGILILLVAWLVYRLVC